MVSLTTLLLTLAASSATVVHCQSPDPIVKVFTDLQQIDNDTNSFNQQLTDWNGNILYALGLFTATMQLQSDINTTTTDVNALNSTITDAEAGAALAYFTSTLEPDVNATFLEVIKRKPDFASANLTSFVLSTIEGVKNQTDALSEALVAKAPADLQGQAKQVAGAFDGFFAAAIQAYSS